MDHSKYSQLIAKIKRKRGWVLGITIVVLLVLLFFALPARLELMGETIYEHEGLPVVISIILFLFVIFIELLAYAVVSQPLSTSLTQECDPEKFLILNMVLNKEKQKDYLFANGYFYLGVYEKSLEYAEKAIRSGKEQMVLIGLFDKARCEFFLGDYDLLRQTVEQHQRVLSGAKKMKPKVKIAYQKVYNVLYLMCAIAEDDIENINQFRHSIESWNTSKNTEVFLNYVKALCAYKVDDKEEAIYRFKAVKEHGPKTALANLSDEYLTLLKE